MVDLLVSTVSGLGRSVAEAAEVSLTTLHVQYYVLHLIRDLTIIYEWEVGESSKRGGESFEGKQKREV